MVTQIALLPTSDGQPPRMTYEAFLAWAGEDTRAEWIDGEVIEFMQPTQRPIQLVRYLLTLISNYVDVRRLGEVYGEPFQFLTRDGRASRRPDVSVLLPAHLDRFTSAGMMGVPDLVVEVISEDSETRDRQDKRVEYAEAGVPEYWVVEGREGRRGVGFYSLQAGGSYAEIQPDAHGRLWSTVLAGFWLDPTWLEQDPMPSTLSLLRQLAPDALHELVNGTEVA